MAQEPVPAHGLDVALTGFLDFLNRVLPQESLSIDAEAARKHCVELIHTLNTTESDTPPEFPLRPVRVDGGSPLGARNTPDCDGNEIGLFCVASYLQGGPAILGETIMYAI
jgi:hypothetical protein